MHQSNKLRRRKFLHAAAAATLLSCGRKPSAWRFFTSEEAETAAAICERFIPADEFPGAAWAGCANYIDRQLTGHFKRYRQAYREGLRAVDETSVKMSGAKFVMLTAARQVEVLKSLEKSTGQSKQFFEMILAHTMQGFYSDPRHGGNRDGVSYRMLGLSLAPVRGRSQHDLRGNVG